MLVLTRREGDRLMIGRTIVVEVVEILGRKVRLAVHAPPDVLILREELLEDARQGRDEGIDD